MFADDKSIENFQQLFFEFKKYLELQKRIHQVRVDGEADHTSFNVNHDCNTYHPWHGSPVLSVICLGLCIGTSGRRTYGKLRYHCRHQYTDYGFSHYFPQTAYHLPDGKLPR